MNQTYRKGLHEFLTAIHPGGIAGIARDLTLTRQTVYAWEKAGQIPDRHAPALIRFCGADDAKIATLSGWTSSAARNNLEKRVARAQAKKGTQQPTTSETAPATVVRTFAPVVQTFGFNSDGIGEIQARLEPVPDELEEPEDFTGEFDPPVALVQGGTLGEAAPPAASVSQTLKPEHQPRRW